MLPNIETVINWEKCMVKFEGHPKSILEKGKGSDFILHNSLTPGVTGDKNLSSFPSIHFFQPLWVGMVHRY